jgi:uncharacterized protein
VITIVDSGPVVAAADPADPRCGDARRCLVEAPGALIIPAPVTAEIDHLIGVRVGPRARKRFLADLAAERFVVGCLTPSEHAAALAVDRRYADLNLGLADASLVVLAARVDTNRLMTFDHRDFQAVTPLQGGVFELLP